MQGIQNAITRRALLKALLATGAATGFSACAARGGRGLLGSAVADEAEELTVTDMAGRQVTFKKNPQKLFAEGIVSEPFLCALAPERLIGWAYEKDEFALQYYPEVTHDLELVGGWVGEVEGNAEAIIALAPDLVVACGFNMEDPVYLDMFTHNADDLSTKLGLPVAVVNLDMDKLAESMRLLGEWIGVPERGAELAGFLQAKLDMVSAVVESVPEDERPTYYYAEDISGLMTEPGTGAMGTCHTQPEEFCGLTSAADIGDTTGYGYEEVSLEQVIQWDPETIFVFEQTALETIRTSEMWQGVKAVRDGRVFWCIDTPANWFDRSPNLFCVLGTIYTCAMVYPEQTDFDLNDEVKEYFATLYGVDLTDEQVEALYK